MAKYALRLRDTDGSFRQRHRYLLSAELEKRNHYLPDDECGAPFGPAGVDRLRVWHGHRGISTSAPAKLGSQRQPEVTGKSFRWVFVS